MMPTTPGRELHIPLDQITGNLDQCIAEILRITLMVHMHR